MPDSNIIIKSKEEIKILTEAGKILSEVLKDLKSSLKPGITTGYIDALAETLIRKHKVTAAFKGYRGFPANICVSINEQIVHGIPGQRVINDGDLVSIDCGIIYKGYYSDAAFSSGVGNIGEDKQKLLDVTVQSLFQGIEQAKVDNLLFDISSAIQKYAESKGFSVVREFVGHGIGKNLHEDPEIPNYGIANTGPVLKEGMVFCLEPMVNMGHWKAKILDDGWTVVTGDGKPSAHFEHTVAITSKGPKILTKGIN